MGDVHGGKSLFEDIFLYTGKQKDQSDTSKEPIDVLSIDRAAMFIYQALDQAGNIISPGIQTRKIDEILRTSLISLGADKNIIINISPEYVVWHGIPDERALRNGEIVTVDIACSAGGWWADAARTFMVGEIDEERRNLVKAAWEGTRLVVSMMKDGSNGLEISQELVRHCETRSVVLIPEGAGHAIGRSLHELPSLTYDARSHDPLVSGRVYTVEPVFTSGNGVVSISRDGITETMDRKPSAHFEVTVLLADKGARICGTPEWLDKTPC